MDRGRLERILGVTPSQKILPSKSIPCIPLKGTLSTEISALLRDREEVSTTEQTRMENRLFMGTFMGPVTRPRLVDQTSRHKQRGSGSLQGSHRGVAVQGPQSGNCKADHYE